MSVDRAFLRLGTFASPSQQNLDNPKTRWPKGACDAVNCEQGPLCGRELLLELSRLLLKQRVAEAGLVGQTIFQSLFTKHSLVVFKKSLYRHALLLHVGKFSLDIHWAHDRWCKHNRHIEGCHLEKGQSTWMEYRDHRTYEIIAGMLNHTRQMEHQELQSIAMCFGNFVDSRLQTLRLRYGVLELWL